MIMQRTGTLSIKDAVYWCDVGLDPPGFTKRFVSQNKGKLWLCLSVMNAKCLNTLCPRETSAHVPVRIEIFDYQIYDSASGCGVFAKKHFEKGQFLLEYVGERITASEGIKRHTTTYKKKTHSYLYFFKHDGKKLWYDMLDGP